MKILHNKRAVYIEPLNPDDNGMFMVRPAKGQTAGFVEAFGRRHLGQLRFWYYPSAYTPEGLAKGKRTRILTRAGCWVLDNARFEQQVTA